MTCLRRPVNRLCPSQFSNVFMYVCRLLAAVSCRGCCEMMLTSSAYESVVTEEFVGVGRSCRSIN